jgi:hypothetical protein
MIQRLDLFDGITTLAIPASRVSCRALLVIAYGGYVLKEVYYEQFASQHSARP